MILALWYDGGLCIDSLDESILNVKLLEKYRIESPFLVVGNFANRFGSMVEPDTVAGVRHEPLFLSLLTEISQRISGRDRIARTNGPHFTVCGGFNAWARSHNLTAWNVVHRSMREKNTVTSEWHVTCRPKPDDKICEVKHAVSWGKFRCCPGSWLNEKVFTQQKLTLGPKNAKQRATKKPATVVSPKIKKKYHFTDNLNKLLNDRDNFRVDDAPESVRKLWPKNGYLNFTNVSESEKLSFVMVCLLSGHSPDQRKQHLDKAIAKNVVKKRSVCKLKKAMVQAKGSWTKALLQVLKGGHGVR